MILRTVVVPVIAREEVKIPFTPVNPVEERLVVLAFSALRFVVEAVTAAKRVAAAFTKFDEVAKRLDEVELVVEALTAAKSEVVALVPVVLVK